MRLFVAVDVDRHTREAAAGLERRIRRDTPVLASALRFVRPDTLHLTLRFLGDRSDVHLLEPLIAGPWRLPSFALGWSSPAWLPSLAHPRVLCVEVGSGADRLQGLAAETDARLGTIGVPPEVRAFTAHLTIARVRDRLRAHVWRRFGAQVTQLAFAPGIRVAVEEVLLVESRLSTEGPTYEVRARARLP